MLSSKRSSKRSTQVADWAHTRLIDLIDIKHGYAFKGEYFREEPPGDFLLTPGNFAIGGGFQWGKRKYYRDGPVLDEFVLRPGDLLVTMTDLSKEADTLGYSAVVPESDFRLLHNQRLGKIIKKSESIELGYLHWLLRSPNYRNEILASYTGSTVKHTSPKKILAYQFSCPPLKEQRKIVAVLDPLVRKIELNRRMNETLEAMARALFKDWFVDFGPTRAKAEGLVPYLTPELWGLFPHALEVDGKPFGWEVSEIGKEVDAVGGATPSTKEPSYWEDGEYHWATPKDMAKLSSTGVAGHRSDDHCSRHKEDQFRPLADRHGPLVLACSHWLSRDRRGANRREPRIHRHGLQKAGAQRLCPVLVLREP